LVKPGGSFKVQMKCNGIDVKEELISWSLAPCDRKLEIEVNCLSNRHTSGDNSEIVGLVIPKGKPKISERQF
jgi:hypothetical protein